MIRSMMFVGLAAAGLASCRPRDGAPAAPTGTPAPEAPLDAASPFRKDKLDQDASIVKGARLTLVDARLPIDFGLVPVGAGHQERRLRFVNDGDVPLIVYQVKGSCCGCIAGDIRGKIFKPGEQGDLIVTLRPEARRGDLNVQITVDSSARNELPSILATARVVADVEASPGVLQFSLAGDGPAETEVVLINHLRAPVTVDRIESPVAELRAKVLETSPEKIRLSVALAPGATAELRACIKVYLSSPAAEPVAIPVLCLRPAQGGDRR